MSVNRALASNNWRVKAPLDSEKHGTDMNVAKESEHPKWNFRIVPKGQDLQSQKRGAENRIYVGNLPYHAKRSDLEAFLRDKGVDVINIDMSIDRFTGRNPSFCFVDLASEEAATSAIQHLNGTDFLGRPLKIGPGVLKRPEPQRQPLISSRWESLPPTDPNADATPDILPRHLLDPVHKDHRLYVGGLPKPWDQHSSDQALRSLFKGFNVVAVSKVKSPHESMKDVPGQHYYAFVDLSSNDDVDAAIKTLDGTVVWGGPLKVNHARSLPFKIFERARFGVSMVLGLDEG